MKQILFAMFAACLIAAGYVMYAEQDLGHLQIRFADFELETDLLKTGAALLALVLILLTLNSFYTLLLNFFSYFGSKRQQRLSVQARQSLEDGLTELAEGRFDKAEKLFLNKIAYNENALLCYLSAARAAQKQGAHDRRDEYLRKAHTTKPTADIAIGLTQAELQVSHGQYEQALAILNNLHKLSPKHAYVLYLLAKTHARLLEWDKLRALIPELHKLKVFPPEKLLPLEVATWTGLYSSNANNTVLELSELWKDTPRQLKAMPDIVEHYATTLIAIGADEEAELVLRSHLNNSWDESTVILYSQQNILADAKQLEHAENWLQQHQHNPYLLLALGKMCIQRSLWGKARSYLDASISISPMPQTYLTLARLLEDHMDELELANKHYKSGLLLVNNNVSEQESNMKESETTEDVSTEAI